MPGTLTSIPGAKGHDTPQKAVLAFFDFMARKDYTSASGYVDSAERSQFQKAIQAAQGKSYSLQITAFTAQSFTGNQSGGNVAVTAVGQSCLGTKCQPLTTSADHTATIPVLADVGGLWFVSGFALPSA
ncbi:MAG: hypothetical protein ACREN2_03625 [Candidatus Dormibacteria bacterium]